MSKITPLNWRQTYRMTDNDIMRCDICCEAFDEQSRQPKFLLCHHSYCEACLQQVAGDQENIECPACRQVTHLSVGGVGFLQTNFYIGHMRDTLKRMGTPKVRGCTKHFNQPLSFFCQKCNVSICRDCTVLEHRERDGHDIADIAEAEVVQRSELRSQMDKVKVVLEEVQTHMIQMEAERNNLTVAKDMVLKNINTAFEKYTKMLEVRKLQLSKNITDLYNTKQEGILDHSEAVNSLMKDITKTMASSERLLQHGPLADVVFTKAKLQQTSEKMQTFMKDLKVEDNNLIFDAKEGELDFKVGVGQLGKIYAEQGLPSRVKFQVPDLTASIPALATMKVFTYNGETFKSDSVGVEVSDNTSDDPLEATISWNEDKECNILFVPPMSGELQLVATFQGQPIKGAETTAKVQSNNPVSIYGGPGDGEGNFKSPRAIGLDTDGSLFIADTGNKVIQKLDKDGEFLYQFRIDGGVEANSTCDLALNKKDGLILCTETIVGSTHNPTVGNTVGVYTKDGKLQYKFNNKSMKCALCVATNTQGQIIISDYLMHSLFMYKPDGKFMKRISHSGYFNHPAFICVTEDDMIIVSDTNNDSVGIFDPNGHFVHSFGKPGSGKGALKQPFGVACDGEHILVVDSGNKRVQVFKRDGTFVSILESKDNPLNQPRGIALTDDGHVYVADRDNHCIKKFKYK